MIQLLRGTKSQLDSYQTVIAEGQPVFEKDTGQLKIGNGSSIYSALPYVGAGSGGGSSDFNGNMSFVGGSNVPSGYIDLDSRTRLVGVGRCVFTLSYGGSKDIEECGSAYFLNGEMLPRDISSYIYPRILGFSLWTPGTSSAAKRGITTFYYSLGCFYVYSTSRELLEGSIEMNGTILSYNP